MFSHEMILCKFKNFPSGFIIQMIQMHIQKLDGTNQLLTHYLTHHQYQTLSPNSLIKVIKGGKTLFTCTFSRAAWHVVHQFCQEQIEF